MSEPRVTFADLELYGGDQPSKLSILIHDHPSGAAYPQPSVDDLPARYLDALRTWLWGGPTGLALGRDGAPQAADELPPYDHVSPCCVNCEGASCWDCRGTGHSHDPSKICYTDKKDLS